MATGRTPRPTLPYLVKQVELAVRAHLDEVVRPEGLTALQYTALTVLERHPDLTSSQLARRTFVTAQSTADLVTVLLGRGLVERHRDPSDRRRLVLALTPAGSELLKQMRPHVAAIERRMLAGLGRTEVTVLRHALTSCRQALAEPAESYSNRAGRRST